MAEVGGRLDGVFCLRADLDSKATLNSDLDPKKFLAGIDPRLQEAECSNTVVSGALIVKVGIQREPKSCTVASPAAQRI